MISSRTTWERLTDEIASHDGAPVAVVGMGGRAGRLMRRLYRELPDEVEIFSNDRSWVAIVHPDGNLAWDPPGGPKATDSPFRLVAFRRNPARFKSRT